MVKVCVAVWLRVMGLCYGSGVGSGSLDFGFSLGRVWVGFE
jgi:hypothetical protein